MPMKKWPLLDSNPSCLDGDPRIEGTRLGTEHVYETRAGSDSDAHVKMFQENWPYVTAKQIKQAIAFERKRRAGQPHERNKPGSTIVLTSLGFICKNEGQ
jgi:uncharacterized protein (DUF433 family)